MRRKTALKLREILFVCGATCLLAIPCYSQSARPNSAQPAKSEVNQVFAADGQSLMNRIKAVESPAFRAYLYLHVSTWLWKNAGEDQSLRRAAVSAATASVVDIHEHENELPPALASRLYRQLLYIVSQSSTEEAARLEQAYPLQLNAKLTEEEKAGGALHTELVKLDSQEASTPQSVGQAVQLINSGKVPIITLQGELFRLDQMKSPALPQVLSAVLALEEHSRGAIPVQNLFFLSSVYLKETTPTELQSRFLAASLTATRFSPAELNRDPTISRWAVKLLQRVLPVMQKLTPTLYAEAAARLAALAPGVPQEDDVYGRIKNSSDQLAQTIIEAEQAADEQLARELYESAARLAKQQGKLRMAVDLLTKKDEDRSDLPEGYSSRDEFLDGVVQDALKQRDVETARYAAAKISLPVNDANALQRIAHYLIEAKDATAAVETLEGAVKKLKAAPDGKEKAVSYLRLASEFLDVDDLRAPEIAREAIKAANSIPRPRDDAEGKFSWLLFPVADNAIKTFQSLARRDRVEALSLADDFDLKEFKVAAALGVYSSTQK